MRRLVALAIAGAVLGAPAAADARARVHLMVVGKSAVLSGPKRVALVARTARVGGERCSIGRATPLSVLAGAGVSFSLKDYGACSRRARDAGSLYVRRIGPDREAGRDGWVYKVGRRAATAGAGDPGGPFGHGRLRARQRVTWFYCVRATDCQRTLEVRAKPTAGGIVATVRGYDDAGDGVPVEGARVSAGAVSGLTTADGRVQLALASGTHRLVARKDGLVRSFTELVEVP